MANPHVLNLNRFGLVLVVFVIILGAFTRLSDAGLGCPDWPGCYGHLLWPNETHEITAAEALWPSAPVDQTKTWPEMVHRYFAGSLLLVVFALTFMAWKTRPPHAIREISTALLLLILCQAAFGAWTVTLKLWPQVVTAHLLGGFATFSLLWVLFLRQGGAPSLCLTATDRATLRGHAVLSLVVVMLQITLGGWMAANYAAWACLDDFPTCFGTFTPSMDFTHGFNVLQGVGPNYLGGLMHSEARISIHWMHRLGALVVLAVVATLAVRLWVRNKILALVVAALLGLQLLLGTLNIVLRLPIAVATAHNGVGALLLLAMVTVNFAPPGKQRECSGTDDI